MAMRTSLLMVTAALILGGASASWARQKADPTLDWRCRITLRDASGDKIQSDSAGAYTDGASGVTCYVVNEPGATHDRWLFMTIENTRRSPSARFIQFKGHLAYPQLPSGTASFADFTNHEGGTFEVKGLAQVEWNQADPFYRDVKPFRAYLRNSQFVGGVAALNGDSNSPGFDPSGTTSSVFVRAIDPCSWTITWDTAEGFFSGHSGEHQGIRIDPRVMRISEGTGKQARIRGDFPMPFQATVSIIGNKAGCPLP